MKKLFSLAAVAALSLTLLAPRAEAQVEFMPYLGYDFDAGTDGGLLIGVGAEFGLLPGVLPIGIAIRPSAEYFFLDDPLNVNVQYFQINADVIGELATPAAGLGIFGGAGLGIGFSSADNVDSSTDLGLNILGGVEVDTGFLSPFLQARLTLMGETRFAILGGVKLGL